MMIKTQKELKVFSVLLTCFLIFCDARYLRHGHLIVRMTVVVPMAMRVRMRMSFENTGAQGRLRSAKRPIKVVLKGGEEDIIRCSEHFHPPVGSI